MSRQTVGLSRLEDWTDKLLQTYELQKVESVRAKPHEGVWRVCLDDPELFNDEQVIATRLAVSGALLHGAVVVDEDIRGGVPVLRGTRISISQVLIEIADGETVEGFADEYDIDAAVIKQFLEGLAIHLDRSFVK